MANGGQRCAVLFADLVGSTALYERLGDETARAMVARALSELTACVHDHGGTVIKSLGDAVMASFAEAAAAMEAATAMHAGGHLLTQLFREGIAFRIGAAFGDVVREDDDLFGDIVNVAARIADRASAEKIFLNEALFLALPEAMQARVRLLEHATVKGRREAVDLYEYLWSQREATVMSRSSISQLRRAIAIELVVEHASLPAPLTLESTQLPFTIGRGEQSLLRIPQPLVSRQHAHIECRNGLLYLHDHSTNGTWLARREQTPIFLHQEQAVLDDEGRISLGDGSFAQPELVLNYRRVR